MSQTAHYAGWGIKITLENKSVSNHIHPQIKRIIFSSHLFLFSPSLSLLQGPPGGGGPPGTPIMPSPGGELALLFNLHFTGQEFCLSAASFLIPTFHLRLRFIKVQTITCPQSDSFSRTQRVCLFPPSLCEIKASLYVMMTSWHHEQRFSTIWFLLMVN